MRKMASTKILGFSVATTIDNLQEFNNSILVTTINSHSYNVSTKDELFREALINSDILLPDGIGIVLAARFLERKRLKKIAGEDLFYYEMRRLNRLGGKCFFLGSSNETLEKILERANKEFPNVRLRTLSPPFKESFSDRENKEMIEEINKFQPDVLFVGMTAPKQEKWAYTHLKELKVGHVCCIGAVFDFYAGRVKRAPRWMINIGLEWFYRLIKEPRRMWKRYLVGNTIFIWLIFKEKVKMIMSPH